MAFEPLRILVAGLSRPRVYPVLLALGAVSVALLAVAGGFEHSPRFLHQIAWGFVALGVFGWISSRSDSPTDPWRGAWTCILQYLLLAFLLLAPSLSSDGDFYYGMTRTMLWNRDLNTMEEGARFSNSWMVERAAEGSAHGFPYHPFPIGVSLLWIPFIGVGHLEALFLNLFDPTMTTNGYSEPYLRHLAIGTAVMGMGVVLFGYLLLRLRFDHTVSSRAILGTLLATPGFYYAFRDSGFPHAASAASIALFLWLWLRAPERTDWGQIFLLAVALSLAALVRWQNCLFALAPLAYWNLFAPARTERSRGDLMLRSALLGGLCLYFCFPQIAIFRLRGPSWLALQHGGSGDFSFASPSLYSLLFDERYGLIPWHPFYLLCGVGGLLFLSRVRLKGMLIWGVWFAAWAASAYGNEQQSLFAPLTLVLTLLPAIWVVLRGIGRIDRVHAPLGLVFLCAGGEVWINASYLLYHGGGDYGNRLIADLIPFAAFGFAYLLNWSRGRIGSWVLSLGYTVCFLWSLSLLWKATPKITRSPVRLTEIFSHSTPAASVVQGLAHFDMALLISGLWMIMVLSVWCGLLFAGVFQAKSLLREGGAGARGTALLIGLAPALTTLWFWVDFRRVDANLYVDNRGSGDRTHLAGAELCRQTFNSELSPFIPPGRDYRASEGQIRFHEVLSPSNPSRSWLFPKKWPEGKPVPYRADRLTILSRVWSDRPLEDLEPMAKIEASVFIPPATQTFILRAGAHTAHPTDLSLPPSSPDWGHRGLGGIPRYFDSQFILSPSTELEVLKISLIPVDATLELGGVWFTRSPNDAPAAWIENPRKHRTPESDRELFGDALFRFLSFPGRPHPKGGDSPRAFSPQSDDWNWPAPHFLFFQDPWRLARNGVPFELQMGNWRGRERNEFFVLTADRPELRAPLENHAAGGNLSRWHAAVALGPRPAGWSGGAIASLRVSQGGEVRAEREIRAGRDVAFWGDPYLPEGSLVWKETRGVHPPVGMTSVALEFTGIGDGPMEWSIELSQSARENEVDLALFGVTLEREE